MSWSIGRALRGPQKGTYRATATATGPDGKPVTAEVRGLTKDEAGRAARLMEIQIRNTGRAG